MIYQLIQLGNGLIQIYVHAKKLWLHLLTFIKAPHQYPTSYNTFLPQDVLNMLLWLDGMTPHPLLSNDLFRLLSFFAFTLKSSFMVYVL